MTELQELTIDDKCLSYIERVLRSGKSLSHMLLERVSFTTGKIHAIAQARINLNQIKSFAYGGIGVAQPARRALAEIAVSYLDKTQNRIVLEDGLARSGDPAVKNKEGVVFCGDEVYYVVTQIRTPEHMERVLQQVRYPVAMLGVFRQSLGIDAADGRAPEQIEAAQLDDVVATLEKVVFGAFDGEGYLLWTKM